MTRGPRLRPPIWLSVFLVVYFAGCKTITPESTIPLAIRADAARATYQWLVAHPQPAYVQAVFGAWHVFHNAPAPGINPREAAAQINSYDLHTDRKAIEETAAFTVPLYRAIYDQYVGPARQAIASQGMLSPDTEEETLQAADLLLGENFGLGLLDAGRAIGQNQHRQLEPTGQ
ncbi:MAG: hypothetical protein JO076_01515 [Verrucomicrobia bacterium]|nr:hypothetical protein [Verrucomicrobiota bacterium]